MGTVDIEDAYIAGLVDAFSDAFEGLGGTVVATRIVFHDQDGFEASPETASDALAAAGIEDIFFPLYPLAPPFIEHLPEALSALPLVSADALLTSEFLGEDASEGLYIAGSITTFGNVNNLTGKSEAEDKEVIETAYGDTPGSFWQHSYDATTLLLDVIRSVADVHDGKLYIYRKKLRMKLAATQNLQGLVGVISYDAFGDCGNGITNVFEHSDARATDAAALRVVYQHVP